MSLATSPRPKTSKISTIAELLHQLGDIPPQRVLFHPTPGTATEADVVRLHDRENRLCELVDSALVEKTVGAYESRVAAILIQLIANYLDEHRLGAVLGESAMLRLAPGLVRIPNVSFIASEQFPEGRMTREPIANLHPDLAVEVLSRGNTKKEMDRKLKEYFRSGSRMVWYIDSKSGTAQVYSSPRKMTKIPRDGTLEGGKLLPGFSLSLRELFERTDRVA